MGRRRKACENSCLLRGEQGINTEGKRGSEGGEAGGRARGRWTTVEGLVIMMEVECGLEGKDGRTEEYKKI